MYGARAAEAGLDEAQPAPEAARDPPQAVAPLDLPARSTQEALWRDAGIVRTREGLERLLEDPHSLARLIAACALAREESRGAHQRTDFPAIDAHRDHEHTTIGLDERPAFSRWD